MIGLAQWERLQIYGRKVRELMIPRSNPISFELIKMIYRHRMELYLTPNLETLIVMNRNQTALTEVFMHPNLTNLSIAVPLSPLDCEMMFDNIKHRLRSLKSITIWARDDIATKLIETGFAGLSIRLHKLHTVSLPYLTSPLLTALSELKNLKSIRQGNNDNVVSSGKVFGVVRKLTFPQLIELDLTGRFQDVMQLLNHVPNLERFRVLAWMYESAGMYQAMLISLLNSHPRLTELDINNLPCSWTFPDDTEVMGDTFVEAVFSSIAIFARLTILRLTMVHPLRFAKDKVLGLLSSLPNLEELLLSCSHIVLRNDAPSASSILILSDFAERCPRLVALGLFVDCRNLPLIKVKPEHTLKLACLNLGVSLIGPYNLRLARYLSYHCLPHCKFESGGVLWPKVIEDKVIAEYGPDYDDNRWDGERMNIEKMFNVFSEIQEQHDHEKRVIMRNTTVCGTMVGEKTNFGDESE